MPPIIIIGMHRAGTSLLTKILSQLGVFIGNDLDDNNESKFFCKLNDWAMFQCGATWDNPYNMQFLTDEIISEISSNFKKTLNSRSAKKYNSNFKKINSKESFWGWKDPRNTFTLEIWRKIYPEAKVVHIYRNPIDVAESLRKREQIFQAAKGAQTKTGLKKKINEKFLVNKRLYSQSLRVNNIIEGVKLWEQYTSAALNIKGIIVHFCYEEMLENPKKIIKELCEFIKLDIEDKNIIEITQTIDKSRKYAFLENPELVEEYKKVSDNKLVTNLGYNKLVL